MNKYARLLLIPLLALSSGLLTACENINDYVGTCIVDTSYEKKTQYSWGSSKVLEERELAGIPSGARLTINKDKSVIFNYPNGDLEVKGKIAFLFGKAYFNDLNFSNDYKFVLKKDDKEKKLVHEYSENKHGVEYTEVTRHIVIRYLQVDN